MSVMCKEVDIEANTCVHNRDTIRLMLCHRRNVEATFKYIITIVALIVTFIRSKADTCKTEYRKTKTCELCTEHTID